MVRVEGAKPLFLTFTNFLEENQIKFYKSLLINRSKESGKYMTFGKVAIGEYGTHEYAEHQKVQVQACELGYAGLSEALQSQKYSNNTYIRNCGTRRRAPPKRSFLYFNNKVIL